jgi:hypothetical protein
VYEKEEDDFCCCALAMGANPPAIMAVQSQDLTENFMMFKFLVFDENLITQKSKYTCSKWAKPTAWR